MPFFILGIGGVIGAIISIFLPETAGLDLPHTIDEAENFGKDVKFFYVPILHAQVGGSKKYKVKEVDEASIHENNLESRNLEINGNFTKIATLMKGRDNFGADFRI